MAACTKRNSRSLLVVFTLCLLVCSTVFAEESTSDSGWDYALRSLKTDLWDLPADGWADAKEIVSDDHYMFWLLSAAGGSIALRQSGADGRIAENFRDNPAIQTSGIDEAIYQIGGPGVHFAAAGAWYLLAAAGGDEFNKDRAWVLFKALSITGASTLSLKLIVNDDTPNGKDLAWPSGHTSSSFTLAAVLDEFYGPAVGIPAYIGAGFVGYRMMDAGDHWASDVLFGGVLGYIVGHHVAGKHMDAEIVGFRVVPLTYTHSGRAVSGLALTRRF